MQHHRECVALLVSREVEARPHVVLRAVAAATGDEKVMTLEADEFLRRFLLHVVPRGFMRIRHFGLLANRTRRDMVRPCRDLLGQPPTEEAPPESSHALVLRLTGVDLARCPVCREGHMQITTLAVRMKPYSF